MMTYHFNILNQEMKRCEYCQSTRINDESEFCFECWTEFLEDNQEECQQVTEWK